MFIEGLVQNLVKEIGNRIFKVDNLVIGVDDVKILLYEAKEDKVVAINVAVKVTKASKKLF